MLFRLNRSGNDPPLRRSLWNNPFVLILSCLDDFTRVSALEMKLNIFSMVAWIIQIRFNYYYFEWLPGFVPPIHWLLNLIKNLHIYVQQPEKHTKMICTLLTRRQRCSTMLHPYPRCILDWNLTPVTTVDFRFFVFSIMYVHYAKI